MNSKTRKRLGLQHNHVTAHRLWRAVLIEYIATTLFVFSACASVVLQDAYFVSTAANNLVAGIVQGFAIGALVYATAPTSGGHLNPAVTFGLMITGDMPILNGFMYIFVQLAGGVSGAALLTGIMPGDVEGNLGTTTIGNGISPFQGVIFELIVTFLLIFTVFGSSADKEHNNIIRNLAPIPIGFSVTAGVIIAFGFTGGSLNPARTFGPALISNTWDHHYIYWAGPLGGALLGGLLYRFVVRSKPTEEEETAALNRAQRIEKNEKNNKKSNNQINHNAGKSSRDDAEIVEEGMAGEGSG